MGHAAPARSGIARRRSSLAAYASATTTRSCGPRRAMHELDVEGPVDHTRPPPVGDAQPHEGLAGVGTTSALSDRMLGVPARREPSGSTPVSERSPPGFVRPRAHVDAAVDVAHRQRLAEPAPPARPVLDACARSAGHGPSGGCLSSGPTFARRDRPAPEDDPASSAGGPDLTGTAWPRHITWRRRRDAHRASARPTSGTDPPVLTPSLTTRADGRPPRLSRGRQQLLRRGVTGTRRRPRDSHPFEYSWRRLAVLAARRPEARACPPVALHPGGGAPH